MKKLGVSELSGVLQNHEATSCDARINGRKSIRIALCPCFLGLLNDSSRRVLTSVCYRFGRKLRYGSRCSDRSGICRWSSIHSAEGAPSPLGSLVRQSSLSYCCSGMRSTMGNIGSSCWRAAWYYTDIRNPLSCGSSQGVAVKKALRAS